MSVILEFSIRAPDFQLGRVLSGPPAMRCEIERIVPTRDMMMPFVWATGEDHDAFEAAVRATPSVRALAVLDTVSVYDE